VGVSEEDEYLLSLNENQLRNIVIVPLLKHMGLRDVIEYHGGSAEKGKDVIGFYQGPLNDRHYVAVVAKAVDIHGSVSKRGSATETLMQAEQALNEPYTDIYGLKEVTIDECWILTSGEIKNTAIESIRGKLAKSNLDKLVRFIDRSKLIRLISDHMPSFWQRERRLLHFAHEVKAPLVGLQSNVSFLQRRWQSLPPERLEQKIEGIKCDIGLVWHLIETFVLVEQKDLPIRPERTNYRNLVLKALSMVPPESRQRVTVKLGDFQQNASAIMADRRLTEHAISCLLDNALRYSTQNVTIEERSDSNGSIALLVIQDSGIGIPSGVEERIFEPGYRAPNAQALTVTGMGMGLAVARRILRQHQGDVKLVRQSDPTEFALCLPMA